MKVAESLKSRVRIFLFFWFRAAFISRLQLRQSQRRKPFVRQTSEADGLVFFPLAFKKKRGLGGDLKADRTHTLCRIPSQWRPSCFLPFLKIHYIQSRTAVLPKQRATKGEHGCEAPPYVFFLLKKKIKKNFKVHGKTKQQKRNRNT